MDQTRNGCNGWISIYRNKIERTNTHDCPPLRAESRGQPGEKITKSASVSQAVRWYMDYTLVIREDSAR